MPFIDGFELVQYAKDAENEDKLFIRWVAGYQSVLGFDEFKRQICVGGSAEDNRSADEILDKVKEIIG